jgi:hypothetical protein
MSATRSSTTLHVKTAVRQPIEFIHAILTAVVTANQVCHGCCTDQPWNVFVMFRRRCADARCRSHPRMRYSAGTGENADDMERQASTLGAVRVCRLTTDCVEEEP